MKFYPEDYTVEVVVKFTDLNGVSVSPSTVAAVLYDGEDAVIWDIGDVPFDAGSEEVTVTIPKEFNVLDDGELRAARILRVELVTDKGSIPRAFSYAIEAEQRLAIMTNTFVTLESAEILALDMPNASGWTVSSDEQKRAALAEAYRRLTQIPMKFPNYASGANYDPFNTIAPREIMEETIIERDMWGDIALDEYQTKFPTSFKKALRRAQFIEANELLQGDNVARKHRAGIITETIGESSVTLRDGRIDYGISSETMKALVGFIHYNMRIKRA